MAMRILDWGSARPGTRSRLMANLSSPPSSGALKCLESRSQLCFTRRLRTKAASWRWPIVRSCMRQRIDIVKKYTAGAASREGIMPMSSTDTFSIKLYNFWHCSCASNGAMRHSSLPDAEKRVQARAQSLGVMPGFPAGLLLPFSHLDCYPKPDSRRTQFGPRHHPSYLAVCEPVPPYCSPSDIQAINAAQSEGWLSRISVRSVEAMALLPTLSRSPGL